MSQVCVIVQGMVLLASTLNPQTVWEFTALLVLLSGHWPPRGLISGCWPPSTSCSDAVGGDADDIDNDSSEALRDAIPARGAGPESTPGNSSDGGSGIKGQTDQACMITRKMG